MPFSFEIDLLRMLRLPAYILSGNFAGKRSGTLDPRPLGTEEETSPVATRGLRSLIGACVKPAPTSAEIETIKEKTREGSAVGTRLVQTEIAADPLRGN